jgi:rhodanese-related sulfurtransferase
MRDMTVREIHAYLNSSKPAPLLLDVREPWEHAICHLADSRLIPMRLIPSTLGELAQAREIVVICHHGVRSRQVALFLDREGLKNVINMAGGLAAWARDVDPNMPTY